VNVDDKFEQDLREVSKRHHQLPKGQTANRAEETDNGVTVVVTSKVQNRYPYWRMVNGWAARAITRLYLITHIH